MNATLTPLHSSIPSNKFYPPHIDDDQSLFRSRLIEMVLPKHGRKNKIIAIEAQAGQGKTTLAYQYITHYKHSYIWYQIGKEDADPVLLLSGLLHSLSIALKDFSSPRLENIIGKGEIGPLDLMRCANILLNDVDRQLHGNLYIVFDDLHLIDNAELTNQLLAYLLDTSPPKLHFVLTSRHPFELKSKAIKNRNAVAYLGTADLALTSIEIEMLFNDVFKRSISIADARKIEDITSGWVMGIVLAAHPMSGSKSFEKASTIDFPLLGGAPTQKDMLEYFQDEIFSHIPDDLHVPFLKLSFVDEIHVDLAGRITGLPDIAFILTELTQENLFIYNLDSENNTFRFHHLFQEFLQARAAKILSGEEIKNIYIESAAYFLERNLIDKALSCYQQGGEYAKMDQLLRRYGVDFVARNRTLTIFTLLKSIPEKILLQYSWLTLFSGILESDFQPQKTLPHLEAARQLFIASGDEVGELLAVATILYYHFVVSGRYHTGASLLPRTEELLIKHRENLSEHLLVLVMRNLAAGFCFFRADMEKARWYIEQARQIAIDNSIRNFMASTVFIKAYIELLSGDRKKFRHEVEISHSLMNDPLVGMSNKLTLRVLHLCNLSMFGDIANFFHQQQLIQDSIDEKVVKQTVAAPYFFIWGCSCFLSMGESAKALDLINRGVNISATAKSEHMLSQLLQWQAYILATHGNTTSAEVKIAESAQLRDIAGGPFYQSFHFIMAGSVYAKLRKKKLAKEAFSKGLELAEFVPSPYLQSCCLIQRSSFKLRSYGENAALKDLEMGLSMMEANGYDHFWGWEPAPMLELLTVAVVNNLHAPFVQELALRRLKVNITDNGTVIPILYFTTLDGFYLNMGDKTSLTVESFTPLQRELLCLILFSKDHKIGQEKVQLILWPDSSPEKSRKKMDTLLGRLRNTFSDNLPVDTKDYIVLNKGILSLENSITDVEEFQRFCETGFRHVEREEFWQAGNQFHNALTLWKGSLPSDTFRNDSIYAIEDSLLTTYEKMSLSWAGILADAERYNEAIPILSGMLQVNGLSEQGVLLLCNFYTATNQPLKIRETLDRYKKALQAMEYQKDEIGTMIDDITNRLGQTKRSH
jgi:ATP/maltotriose-dependent transcriptional regulator MalT/DNA-binding SARP family transcriptional activator